MGQRATGDGDGRDDRAHVAEEAGAGGEGGSGGQGLLPGDAQVDARGAALVAARAGRRRGPAAWRGARRRGDPRGGARCAGCRWWRRWAAGGSGRRGPCPAPRSARSADRRRAGGPERARPTANREVRRGEGAGAGPVRARRAGPARGGAPGPASWAPVACRGARAWWRLAGGLAGGRGAGPRALRPGPEGGDEAAAAAVAMDEEVRAAPEAGREPGRRHKPGRRWPVARCRRHRRGRPRRARSGGRLTCGGG